jgi:transcription initiation factor IIE alpha subunit
MHELTVIEDRVKQLIPYGCDSKRSSTEISDLTGLNLREVQAVIRVLSLKGVPIVAKRNGGYADRGYYIATNETERVEGLQSFKRQCTDMMKRIEAVEAADLDNWQDNFKQAQ